MIEKKDWIKRYEKISCEWLAFGLPDTIICPKKYDITPICNALNIQLDQNITRRMNRWAKTLQDNIFCRLPGNIHLTKNDRRFNPEKKASLLMRDLEELIVMYIVAVHHRIWNSNSLGVPTEIFNEGIKRRPLREPGDPVWREKLNLIANHSGPKNGRVRRSTDNL
ncbi:hypothetical protein ACLBWT_18810 [Paenibacillus sp. D51F]